MSYNTLNYTEQGGANTHIGGTLTIDNGGTITGLPDATTEAKGVVKMAANQAASTATTVAGLKDDLNTLLAALKTAGIMAADPVVEGGGE